MKNYHRCLIRDCNMAATCTVHFRNVNTSNNITIFTDISWTKALYFASEWKLLDGEAHAVSVGFDELVESGVNGVGNCAYHRQSLSVINVSHVW